jgi:SAM-dependent methyltransferase
MSFLRRLRFNLRYYRNPAWDTGISPPELMAFISGYSAINGQGRGAGRALDLGCGTATNVITLAQHGWQVTGVDFAWTGIGRARRKARRAGVDVDLRVGDVTREGVADGVYDLVLDIGCFHSLTPEGRAAYVRNLERLMAPGGTFLLYASVRVDEEVDGRGVPESELTALAEEMELVSREDGTNRGRRPSVWLTFRRM